jgi:hypothetical protein
VAFPGTGAIRSLYLDGYGALFIVNVGFPLQPPPLAKPREERPPADSSWEEAKRELHTPGPDTMMARSPGEEFDQEKATRLEDALLDALKNASHIRGLKSDDSITICVLGGGVPLPMRNGPKGEPDPFFDRAEAGGFPGAGNQGGSRATTLTLRVKKADVEALAKGKLATSDFRKRASITTGIGPVTGGMPFSGTFFGGGFGGSGGGGGFGGSSGGGGGNRP